MRKAATVTSRSSTGSSPRQGWKAASGALATAPTCRRRCSPPRSSPCPRPSRKPSAASRSKRRRWARRSWSPISAPCRRRCWPRRRLLPASAPAGASRRTMRPHWRPGWGRRWRCGLPRATRWRSAPASMSRNTSRWKRWWPRPSTSTAPCWSAEHRIDPMRKWKSETAPHPKGGEAIWSSQGAGECLSQRCHALTTRIFVQCVSINGAMRAKYRRIPHSSSLPRCPGPDQGRPPFEP
ncbi:hypothetical protein BOSEA31B_11050 [Hyphomicrobiales bacterium]|nr:hypothetical protein BOSEA31B_11050 [Hyphomicrobiales bacterium]